MLSTLRWLGMSFALAIASSAGAGVLAPNDLAATEAARAAADASPDAKLAAPGSRTVDMLIEMQSRKVGVDFTERHGAGAAVGSKTGGLPTSSDQSGGVATAGSTAPVVDRAGLFGTQAKPVIARDVRAATSTSSDLPTAAADPAAAARSNARMEVPWWMHPAGWIDAAVEHSAWIGALAGLILIGWAGARSMSRRWR